jgi:uncharacterized protein
MKTETKTLAPFAVKALDDDALTFEGLASTWDLDLGGDIIHRGAFARTLDHWRGSSKIIPLIDQHNYGSVRAVVGKLLEARETDEGLWTKWQILDTEDGREVWARLKGGYVDGLSIGYRPVGETSVDEAGHRHLKEIALEEVSVVIWPMNPGARASAIKSMIKDLSEEDRRELGALLKGEAPAEADPEPEGLAPDDPQRLEMEEAVRAIIIRSLGGSTDG